MRAFSALIYTVILLATSGCVTNSQKKHVASQKVSPALRAEQRRSNEEKRQDQKDLAMVLQKKRSLAGQRFHPSKTKLEVIPSSPLRTDLSEGDLYGELNARYQRYDEIGFDRGYRIFRKNYSKSRYLDDVIYLKGMTEVARKNYGPALKDFNEVIKSFKKSNRMSEAIFAKAMVLKKMNLPELALENLIRLQKQFPQSAEAMRAQAEVKIVKEQIR